MSTSSCAHRDAAASDRGQGSARHARASQSALTSRHGRRPVPPIQGSVAPAAIVVATVGVRRPAAGVVEAV
jgi:hypothetical protein